MPNFEFTSPEGKTYTVTGPEGATHEQAFQMLQTQLGSTSTPKAEAPSGFVPDTLRNYRDIAAGAIKGASRIGDTLLTPIDALARKLGIEKISFPIPFSKENIDIPVGIDRGAAVDQYMAERADPKSLAYMGGDIASQIAGTAGAGGVLAKGVQGISQAPRALKLAEALRTGGMAGGGLPTRVAGGVASGAMHAAMIDPDTALAGGAIGGALPVAGKLIPMAGRGAAHLIGGIGTHTGGEGLKAGARAGMEGGKKAATFAENMRGKVPMQDVLDTAKANLQVMGQAKSAEYRAGMAQVSGDKSILKFNGIDNALNNARNVVTFKGQTKNVKAAELQQKIAGEIENWKNLDPTEFHTPEGLDALKQKIGGIVESIPFEEKTARMVGKNIYNSIKDEITKQAPVYAKTMKGYAEATEQIKEIERALSLGGKASVDTAMRKLQSLMRNNVNTNYGNRLDLARQLEQQGGGDITAALAGQSLSAWTPRSLGGAVAGGLGMGGYALGGLPAAIPVMASQSPRLMGEGALATGRLAGLIAKPNVSQSIARTSPVLASLIAREGNRKDQPR